MSCAWRLIAGVQETVLLVNHALARGTPAIFVIFVVSRGSSSKALVLLVRMQIRHFRHFRQTTPFFWRGTSTVYQKHRFRDPDIVKRHTVRTEIITELILERAGPVIFKTFLLEFKSLQPDSCNFSARRAKPENYWNR